jgi:hypothetical protein
VGSFVERCSPQQRHSATTSYFLNSLLPCLFIFDGDDDPSPDPPSADFGPLELKLGAAATIPFEGFELDEDTAATAAFFAAAALFTLFNNGLGEILFICEIIARRRIAARHRNRL